MTNKYRIKKTDPRYYEKNRYVGETWQDSKIRMEKKRKSEMVRKK